MREEYGQELGQKLPDPDWIHEMTEKGLVLLSKDAQIRKVHADDVVSANARVFLIPDQQSPAAAMIERYVNSASRIARAARQSGPFIYMVHRDNMKRVQLPRKRRRGRR